MKIETGNPTETGHYVCYFFNSDIPRVVRFWLAGGHGWLANLAEVPASRSRAVAAWMGPLPMVSGDFISPQETHNSWSSLNAATQSAPDINEKPALEFDL